MCRNLKSIILPSSLSEIGDGAFHFCENLKKIYISDIPAWCKITTANNGTPFYEGYAIYLNDCLLENLTILESISDIKASSFSECGSIISVNSCNVKNIGNAAFSTCDKLKVVNLNEGVESLGWYAFDNCKSLETVNLYATTPPTTYDSFHASFPAYMTLHVPKGIKEIYEKADGWKDFGTIIDDLPNESGIENILIDNTQPIEIYNLEGKCVFSGFGNYELKSGFYIIRQGSKCKKIIIE